MVLLQAPHKLVRFLVTYRGLGIGTSADGTHHQAWSSQELRNNGPWDAGVQPLVHTNHKVVLKTIIQYLPLSLPSPP